MSHLLAAAFFAGSVFFVWRSFYGMRIQVGRHETARPERVAAGTGRPYSEKPVSKCHRRFVDTCFCN